MENNPSSNTEIANISETSSPNKCTNDAPQHLTGWICEVCGHINYGNSLICEMCSNYLFDSKKL